MSAAGWTRRVRAGLVASAVLATSVAGALSPQPAQADSGRCPAGTGVTVVVDYGALGGGVQVRCDPGGAGKSGWDVVTDAGFPLQGVASQPGFVCRITGKPGADTEACQRTPPSNRYWGLFWSDGKSGWKYSSSGVGGLRLKAGSSIGWRWQTGGRTLPGAAPTRTEQPAPAPAPSSPSPRPSSGSGGTGSGTGGAAKPDAPDAPASAPARGSATPGSTPSAWAAAVAKRKPGTAERTRGEKVEKKRREKRAEARADRAADRDADRAESEDSDDEAEVTSADSELVQPVSGEGGNGSSTGDALLLVGAALAAMGLAGFGVVTARRRRT